MLFLLCVCSVTAPYRKQLYIECCVAMTISKLNINKQTTSKLNIIRLKQISPFKVSQQATYVSVKVDDETQLKVSSSVHLIKAKAAKCLNDGRDAAV